MILRDNVPTLLYKYRKLDARFYDIIKNKELWFQSPLEFNDPFDCNVSWSADFTVKDIATYISQHALGVHYPGDIEQLIGDFEKYPNHIEKYIRMLKEETLKQGVCCFTTNGNNPLMWAHYGDSYKGVCIGFDGEELLSSLGKILCYSVDYHTDFPKVSFKENTFQAIHQIVSTKSIAWEYEKEYRLTIPQRGKRVFAKKSLVKVCFGLRVSENEIKMAITTMKENDFMPPNTIFYKSQMDNNSYKINYVDVSNNY